MPSFFRDLNLDQVFASMVRGREEYGLQSLFSVPLYDVESIIYRQEVIRDLERTHLRESIASFAWDMKSVRKDLAQGDKLSYEKQRERWFLDSVEIYCRRRHPLGTSALQC